MVDYPNGFEQALVEELARFSDNSMRDGQQSLDKNRVPGVLTVTTIPSKERYVREILDTAERIGVTNYSLPGDEY